MATHYMIQRTQKEEHAGSAILIKSTLKHYIIDNICEEHLQATNINTKIFTC